MPVGVSSIDGCLAARPGLRLTEVAVTQGLGERDTMSMSSSASGRSRSLILVLYSMCVIMAVAALVALRGLKRGVQEDTAQAAEQFSGERPGDPDADLDPAFR